MITYEDAISYRDAIKLAMKHSIWNDKEKENMAQILSQDTDGRPFGSCRIFEGEDFLFVVHEATIGFNVGIA